MGSFEQWAIDTYDEHGHEDGYPHEGMTELCDDAVAWLNSGQSVCPKCAARADAIRHREGEYFTRKDDPDGIRWCRNCTGTGRGDRIAGQNFPPVIPEGTAWSFEDGDFGLYRYDEDGNVTD